MFKTQLPPSQNALTDLRILMAASTDLMLVYDFQGYCEYVVETQRTRGQASPEVYNRYFDYGGALTEAIRSVARDNQPVELDCRSLDGSWYSVLLTGLPDNRVLLVGRDITARKQSETNLQKSKDDLVKQITLMMAQIGQTNERLTAQVEELELRNRSIGTLSHMASLLQSCLTPAEAHTLVARFMPELFPGSSGMLAMTRESRNLVELETAWGNQAETMPAVFAPSDCWALRNGRVHDSARLPVCLHIDKPLGQGCVCVPMQAQGETLGVLHLNTEIALSVAQGDLLLAAAEQIALAIANLRLRARLKIMSVKDSLTGLFNRRYLEELLDRELLRARRAKTSVAVLMIDVDHFKRFNDTYGHEAGDNLLRGLGAMLQEFVRGEDIACRYGGEEFTLILPGTDLEIARRRADELRMLVRNNLQVQCGNELARVSLSLGVAAYPEHGDERAALLKLADQALYQAKHGGRDQVVVAPVELAKPLALAGAGGK